MVVSAAIGAAKRGSGIQATAIQSGSVRRSAVPGSRSAHSPFDCAALLTLLSDRVVARFSRISSGGAMAIALPYPRQDADEDAPPNPGHVACQQYAITDYCRESWQLHAAQLQHRPETHWHRCDYGRFCAVAPVVYRRRCLAVVRLNCPSAMPEAEFERQVELLDLLVRDFVHAEATLLKRLAVAEPAAGGRSRPAVGGKMTGRSARSLHPQIREALRYIEVHLADPALAVTGIAEALAVHPNYLSHLFVEQMGQRMGRFITAQRIERAKTLLATTRHEIKEVARAVGFANPSWFCYVFRTSTAATPGAFRRKSRSRSRNG
jgi:AraC-like DNA-binding protein